ncbi:MAG: hypothetical protein H7A23_16435 [Leptospiraceae bacterium]|nr:hypothetical protein [Leptospiraceae bacterium]MCP5496136.1 hypothetical protein [Leptospiraceae bacterium]
MLGKLPYYIHSCGGVCFESFSYCSFCGEQISLYKAEFVELSREHYHPKFNPCFFNYNDESNPVHKLAIRLEKKYGVTSTISLNKILIESTSHDFPETFLSDENHFIYPEEFSNSKIIEFSIHPNNIPLPRRNKESVNTIKFIDVYDRILTFVQVKILPYPILKAKTPIQYVDLSKVQENKNEIEINFELIFQNSVLEITEGNINFIPVNNTDGQHIEILKHIHYKKIHTGNPAYLQIKIPLGPLQEYISDDATGRKAIISFEPVIYSIFKSRINCETLTIVFEQRAIIIIREWILPENARVEMSIGEEIVTQLTFKNDGRVGGFFRFKRFESLSTNIGIELDDIGIQEQREVYLSKASDVEKNFYLVNIKLKDIGKMVGTITCKVIYEWWSVGQNEKDARIEYKTFSVIIHKEKKVKLIALDFGTTSSCVATSFVGDMGEEKLGVVRLHDLKNKPIQGKVDYYCLDKNNKESVDMSLYEIPTVIQYIVKEDNTIEKLIGRDILREQKVNTFELFKMEIGTSTRYDIFTPDNIIVKRYSAEDLAKDFITGILQKASKVTGKPEKIIATHPVKFTYQQINKLIEIFSELGYKINENLKLMDEASASLYDVVFHRCEKYEKELQPKESKLEKVLIYDLGGGSLDITYNKVTYNKASEGLKFRARIEDLDSDGDYDFSGCNITRILLDIIVEKMEVFKQKQGMKIIRKANRKFLNPVNRGEVEIYHASNLNEEQLFKFSEKSKINILMQKPNFDTIETPYSLTAIYGREVREIYFGKREGIVSSESYVDLVKIITDIYKDDDPNHSFYGRFFHRELKRSLIRIQSVCKKHGNPDLIILNGQAAQTSLIKDYLNKIYEGIVHFNDPENISTGKDKPGKYMKFSVAIGAVLSEMEGIYDIKSGESSRKKHKYTRTRVGWMMRTVHGLKFQEMIGKKKKLFHLPRESDISLLEQYKKIERNTDIANYAFYEDQVSLYYDDLKKYRLELVEKLESSDEIDDLKNSIKPIGILEANLHPIDEDLFDEDDYVLIKRTMWLDEFEKPWMFITIGDKVYKTEFHTFNK